MNRRHALGLVGAAPLALSATPALAQTRTLRIGGGLDDAYMEPYYAVDLGLFKKANIEVELVRLANSAAIPAAAAAGAIDIGMAEPSTMALAVGRGLPFAYFAGGPISTRENATLVLCTAKNGAIKTPKDLEGKTIAVVGVRSTLTISVTEWLRVNGVDPSSVKFFELHFAEMAAAVQRGTVDAALLGEPFLTENKADLRTLGVPFDTVANTFYIFSWFAKRDWLAANTDLAHTLAGIFYDVARWVNGHHPESAVIQAKYTKLDIGVVRSMARNTMSTSLNPAYIQPVLDIAARYKLLDKPVNASDLIYPGFS
jgi:NitT/TauT family transport system substrate-binding protein